MEQDTYNFEEPFNPPAAFRPGHDDGTPRATRPGQPDDTPRATRPRGQAATTPTITLTSSGMNQYNFGLLSIFSILIDLKKIIIEAQAPLVEDIQG